MLSYPIPDNMLQHDVVMKSQSKDNSEDLEQVGSKEKERAYKQNCMLSCSAENIDGDQ